MPCARKRKTALPCAICRLHVARCICAQIPRLELRTRLALVIHHREVKRTTNSGILATRALVNSSVHVRGKKDEVQTLIELGSSEFENVVLYPAADAVDLAEFRPRKPVRLIVVDGNWRQAAKMPRREPVLKDLPRVRLTQLNRADYHLRAEHRPDGFSTLEAIARAMGYLEGPAVEEELLALYRFKLDATRAGRGQ